MKKLLLILLLLPVFASASSLTSGQIQAIVGLLQAFNAEQGVISRVQAALSGGGTSATVAASATGAPAVSLIFPSSFAANQSTSFTLYGSGFQSGATVVYSGASSGTIPATFVSATSLFFTRSFPAGSYTFKVQNPGGQTSAGSVSVTAGAGSGFGTNTYAYTPPVPTGTTGSSCPAVTCSGAYPLTDSATNRCYVWSGGSCNNKCLQNSTTNCLYPSYASGACSCVYPVDFSPAYSEACIGTPQKTYQPGQTACVPTLPPEPISTGCAAPAGWSCVINPRTLSSGTPGGYPKDVLLDMTRFNPYVFSAGKNEIHAFPITFDSSIYVTTGATFVTNQFSNVNTNRRDMYISDKPGSITPLDPTHFGCRTSGNAESSSIYIRFTTPIAFTGPLANNPNFGTCFLKKDTQYWLNIKPTNPDEAMNYFLLFNGTPT